MNAMNQIDLTAFEGLSSLERQVRRDLELLNLPAKNWLIPHHTEAGDAVLDVAIVGAGMNGIAAAASLKFGGIHNLEIFEASAPGFEGPWNGYARMDTLRSPKTLPGPALGVPTLTFRAWYEAAFGRGRWDALYKIENRVWTDYLSWLQRVLDLPVRHGVTMTRVVPGDRHVSLDLVAAGKPRTVRARRVVLATGRRAAGGDFIPSWVDKALWPDLAAHTNENIDFAQLAGKSIAVVGGGASAWDNAAVALERGAANVDMYVRRHALPQINKGRGSASPAFHHGWNALSDAERWSLFVWMNDQQAPPPHETVLRALKPGGLTVHLGHATHAARREAGTVVLDIEGPAGRGCARHDFLIVATGFAVDLARVPELDAIAPHVARWDDVYRPPDDERREDLAGFPYLGPGFELLPRDASAPAGLSRIYLLNYGAHASHGGIASDIPGVNVAAERLASAVSDAFFREDIAVIRRKLEEFDEPELKDTPFFVPRAPRRTEGAP